MNDSESIKDESTGRLEDHLSWNVSSNINRDEGVLDFYGRLLVVTVAGRALQQSVLVDDTLFHPYIARSNGSSARPAETFGTPDSANAMGG